MSKKTEKKIIITESRYIIVTKGKLLNGNTYYGAYVYLDPSDVAILYSQGMTENEALDGLIRNSEYHIEKLKEALGNI